MNVPRYMVRWVAGNHYAWVLDLSPGFGDFGIANMGSGVIRVIEMILWGGLRMAGHDNDGGHTVNCRADLILNQFSHPAIFQNSLT